jgi:hypothetical protein
MADATSTVTPSVPPSDGAGNGDVPMVGSVDPSAGGVVKPGEKSTVELVVDDADFVTFLLFVFKADGTRDENREARRFVFSVRGPNGESVSTEAPTQYGDCGATGFPGITGYGCSIKKPAAGIWEATVEAKQAPDEGMGFSVQTQFLGGVQIVPDISKNDVASGEPVELRATILDPAPVTGATVEAWITVNPDDARAYFYSAVSLVERGAGVYTGEFKPPSAGSYRISFRAKGQNSRGTDFIREAAAALNVQPPKPK